jgi:hypothetical protein
MVTESDVSTQDSDSDASGHYNYTVTKTWRATDVSGNFVECNQLISVQDISAPTALCQSITVYLDEDGVASVSADDIDDGSFDNCSGVSLSLDGIMEYECVDRDSSFTVTLTVTDVSGNSSSCTATVTVSDDTLPDDDCDGVSNVCDVCPSGDDSIDNNNDGIADCSQLLNYNEYDSDWYCGNNKILVCHIPSGNPENRHTICINKNALPAHFNNHGDNIGPCTSCATENFAKTDNNYNNVFDSFNHTELGVNDMVIYPNPATNNVHVYFMRTKSATKVDIYDVYGKKIWSETAQGGQIELEIDLSLRNFENGMYIINVSNDLGNQSKQLVIYN